MNKLRWIKGVERTPPEERERTSKFSTNFRTSKRQVAKQFELMGVDAFYIDHITGSAGDSGIVIRWEKNDQEYAVACDAYTTKSANLREAYLWLKETRKRNDRNVTTAADEMAAAALPPGDEDAESVVVSRPPHEVLGVDRNEDREAVIKAAYQERIKETHADQGGNGDPEEIQRIQQAKEEMLNGG